LSGDSRRSAGKTVCVCVVLVLLHFHPINLELMLHAMAYFVAASIELDQNSAHVHRLGGSIGYWGQWVARSVAGIRGPRSLTRIRAPCTTSTFIYTPLAGRTTLTCRPNTTNRQVEDFALKKGTTLSMLSFLMVYSPLRF